MTKVKTKKHVVINKYRITNVVFLAVIQNRIQKQIYLSFCWYEKEELQLKCGQKLLEENVSMDQNGDQINIIGSVVYILILESIQMIPKIRITFRHGSQIRVLFKELNNWMFHWQEKSSYILTGYLISNCHKYRVSHLKLS